MHFNQTWLIVALVAGLTACGEPTSENEETTDSPPATQAAPAAAPAATPTPSAGGYEPNESERVPGITMSQEELDQLDKAARANMPAPVIPAE